MEHGDPYSLIELFVCAAFFFLSLLVSSFLLLYDVFMKNHYSPWQFVTWDGPSQRANGHPPVLTRFARELIERKTVYCISSAQTGTRAWQIISSTT